MDDRTDMIHFADLSSFSLTEKVCLPKVKSVYFVLNHESHIICIGRTNNLRARFYKHHREKEFLAVHKCKIAWLMLSETDTVEEKESLPIQYEKLPVVNALSQED